MEAFERWPLAGIKDVLNLDLSLKPVELEPLLSLNYNFASTVIRIVDILAHQGFGSDISWTKFDHNPYDMMLDLLAYKRLDFGTLVSVLTAGPLDYTVVPAISPGNYICLDTGSILPLTTILLWPHFCIDRRIASAYPLRGARFSQVTGFGNLDELNAAIMSYAGSKLGKRYFNLDKRSLSMEKTWSKIFHDSNLKVCTKIEARFNFIRCLDLRPTITPETAPLPISSSPSDGESKPRRRKTIPKSVREDIWRRDCGDSMRGHCFCCGNELHHSVFEAGHIVAHADGGSDDVSNLVVICSLCNRSMGKTNMREFVKRYYASRTERIVWP
mgnify:CR=1 FL=1